MKNLLSESDEFISSGSSFEDLPLSHSEQQSDTETVKAAKEMLFQPTHEKLHSDLKRRQNQLTVQTKNLIPVYDDYEKSIEAV